MTTITEKSVAALDHGTTLWDDKLKGFCARRRDGDAVMFGLKYRVAGRQRWLTLGRWQSPLSVADARRAALDALSAIAAGKDPAAEKDMPVSLTVAQAADRWLSEQIAPKRKPRTAQEYRRLVENVIRPALGSTPIDNLSRAQVAAFHHGRRAAPIEANRALACLSTLWNWAQGVGILPDSTTNPCQKIERNPQRVRERFLSADEMARLGDTLTGHDNALHVAAIKLLIFTGARLGEILTLRWDQVDGARGEARLLDHKTDRHLAGKTIHLGAPALAVLNDLPRIEGVSFVLGENERKPGEPHGATWIEAPWRVIRKKARLDDVRIHDLRHSFASVTASSGMSLPIIGKMLGHTQQATTQRYAHLARDPVAAAAESVRPQSLR